MNAIDLLKSQHRNVDKLFARIESTTKPEKKYELFEKLADSLAVHASIEEHQFYPSVKAKRTQDILLESLEEHLAIKRVISDIIKTAPKDVSLDAKLKFLKEVVQHHVEEEESDLFPKVQKLLGEDELEQLGQGMTQEVKELESAGAPRDKVPSETDQAPAI